MSYLKKIYHHYYDNLYLLVITYSLIFPFLRTIFNVIGYKLPGNSLLMTSFMLTLGMYFLKVFKKYILSLILFLEITFIGLIILNYLEWVQLVNKELFTISNYLFDYLKVEIVVDAINSYANYISGLSNFILYPIYFETILQVLIIGVIFYFVFNYKSPYYLLGIGLLLIYAWFQYKEISMTKSLIYLLGMLLYTYEYYHYKALLKGKNNAVETSFYRFKSLRLSYIIMAIIIFASTQLMVVFFPVDQINQKISKYIPRVQGLRTAYYKQKSFGYYTLENSMYYPLEDVLGGSVNKNSDELLMYIKTRHNHKYFRGRVKNKYTGEQWINENTSYERDSLVDTRKNLLEAEIQPINLKTITLFSPYKFVKSSFKASYIYSNEDSIQFYRGPKIPALEKSYTVYWTNEYTEELSESEEKKYLNYPSSDLTHTKNIVDELINEKMTDYDKVKVIERYLRRDGHFRYSLSVSDQKKSRDFVENFITYEKKGYCTYFASAMAIMGRMANVPTRYVEGFILPREANGDGYYEITESRAHAWVEAYIENKGWVVLEATPAYTVVQENVNESEAFNDQFSLEENNFENEITNTIEKDLRIGEDFITTDQKNSPYRIYLYGIVLFLSLLLIIRFAIRNYMKRKNQIFKALSDHDKAQKYLERIIRLLSILGFEKKENEFELDFIEKILENEWRIHLEFLEKMSLEKLLYTNKKLNHKEYIIFKEIYTKIFNNLLGNKNALTQLYFQFRIR